MCYVVQSKTAHLQGQPFRHRVKRRSHESGKELTQTGTCALYCWCAVVYTCKCCMHIFTCIVVNMGSQVLKCTVFESSDWLLCFWVYGVTCILMSNPGQIVYPLDGGCLFVRVSCARFHCISFIASCRYCLVWKPTVYMYKLVLVEVYLYVNMMTCRCTQ